MALVLKDRVKETTTTTGTGTYTLAGAVTGFEAFSSVGDGNTTYYSCTDGTDFEVGIGTYTASGTTLARTTILQSSNSDSAVSWSSGTKTIFCAQPAEKAVFLDASGNIIAANGSALTALNASNLASGTVANARLDQQLQDVAGLAVTNGNFIVGDGSNFVAESGATARTSLGLGTAAVLDTGISNTNIPKFTSGVADDDFLRVDGTAIEGRSASQVLSDIAAMPLAGGTFTGDVILTDTDSGALEGPLLTLRRDSSSPADNDVLGHIKFKGDNDAGENVFYAGINAKINDNTDGTEDGLLDLSVMANGTIAASRIRIQGNGDTVISNRDLRLNTGVDLRFEGATSNDHEITLTVTDPTADRTITLPDATGTVLTTADSGIGNGNVATFTSGVADNDFLRIDGTSVEGRSASEVLSDIGATTATAAADEATALAIALG